MKQRYSERGREGTHASAERARASRSILIWAQAD